MTSIDRVFLRLGATIVTDQRGGRMITLGSWLIEVLPNAGYDYRFKAENHSSIYRERTTGEILRRVFGEGMIYFTERLRGVARVNLFFAPRTLKPYLAFTCQLQNGWDQFANLDDTEAVRLFLAAWSERSTQLARRHARDILFDWLEENLPTDLSAEFSRRRPEIINT